MVALGGVLVLAGLAGCGGQAPASSVPAQEVGENADPDMQEAETSADPDTEPASVPAEGESAQRKERSMAIVAEHGVEVMEGLPMIETEEQCAFQTPEQISRRAVALMVVALYSESMLNPEIGDTAEEAKAFIAPIIEQYGVTGDFSAAESAYLEKADPTEQEMVNYSWQYENLGVMLWALGFMDELAYPDAIVDVPFTVQTIQQFDTIEAMVAGAAPRTPAEILDEADLIYRLDWACVDARINGREAPGGLDAGVVMERHKSLNWLIRQGEDWDEIDIST